MEKQYLQFKPIENMEPMEMVTEIVNLRKIANQVAYLIHERNALYTVLLNMGIVPIIFPVSEGDEQP